MNKLSILFLAALLLVACDGNTPQSGKAGEMTKSAKRGVSFNFSSLMDLPLLCPSISWDYNWGNSCGDEAATWFDANGVEFCPMCWSGSYSKDKIRQYVAAHPSTKYLLAFNEPNLTDQANMTPAVAAQLWPDVVALAKELNLKLVSPAMNYGTLSGYSNPIKWLDEFFQQPGVSIDDVDAIAIHCYMGSYSALKGYVEMFYKYDKPIWMTEFCAWEQTGVSEKSQMDYMCAVLNYFEQNERVERYAWFIPRYKNPGTYPYMQLLTNASGVELTELGKMFTLFSSFDKSVYLPNSRFIHAGEYIGLSDNTICVRPTNDSLARVYAGKDGLMAVNLVPGMSLSYQVNVSENATELTLRYSGLSQSIAEVLIDGKSINYADMPRTGGLSTWNSSAISAPVKKGNHTITVSITSGNCYLSGFLLK